MSAVGFDGEARERELAALRVPPPSPQRVARRVLCLTTGHMRGKLELAARAMLEREPNLVPKFQEARANVAGWVAREGFGKEFAREESIVLLARPGQLGDQPITDASWWAEAAIPLLWALGHLEAIPPYDWMPPDPSPLEMHVPFLKPTRDFVEQASLRPAAQIAAARDLAQRWHWRARTTQLQRAQPGSVANTDWFRREVLEHAAADLVANGDVAAAIDGDFPAFGKPYAALSDDEYDYCRSLAMERHKALNWLCGYAERWDKVPTDT